MISSMPNEKLNSATKSNRIVNFVVDMIVILVTWLAASIGLILLGFDDTYTDEVGDQVPVVPMLIILPIFWGYYIFTEFIFQRTLGKLVTRTKVVTKNGKKPSFWQILGRTLSRSIPLEYLSYFVTSNGIHDRLSGTRVVKQSS